MIVAVPCPGHAGCVDIRRGRSTEGGERDTDDLIHVHAGEWREFADAVKDGKYDDVNAPAAAGGNVFREKTPPAATG